jgi:tRNA-specific 2-thiouridylase
MSDDHAFLDHAVSPRGQGRLPNGAHLGAAGGSACGDVLCVGLSIGNGRVERAGFRATACSATLAAAGALVEMVEGSTVLAAARVGEAAIAAELGGLSPATMHAARLAADALHRALAAAAADPSVVLAEPAAGRRLVAMSGGVDSAAAAMLLDRAGHEVVAVTLQLWDDPQTDGNASCCSPQAVAQARDLAHTLGVPHLTLDLRAEFRAGVVDPYLAAFGDGLTPNPCVGCNGHVRFDALDALRERLGAATLATGHYARIEHDGEGPLLAAAADDDKDQTYMLAAVPSRLLGRLEFPLGELRKPQVRQLARDAGLSVADKPESQDLCFIAGIGRDDFLRRHAEIHERPGVVVDRRGRPLGTHAGAHRFTVGQRRGLGVAAAEPLYVLDVDIGTNTVVAGPRDELATRRVRLLGANLLRAGDRVTHVKLRYRNRPLPCALQGSPAVGRHRELWLDLDEPVDGAAPGQVACLLRGDAVVGWATIARSAAPPQTESAPLQTHEPVLA